MERVLSALLLAALCVQAEPRRLEPFATIDFPALNESSGIVPATLHEGVFFTHNDSGDEARLFAINRKGQVIQPEWAEDYRGIRLPGAVNVDWEDITRDLAGNLLVADTGNNANQRRDLCVYVVPEPGPRQAVLTRPIQEWHFHYPDQFAFPPEKMNYDCEAVFWADNALHLLTKHRSDTETRLFRLDRDPARLSTPLTLVGAFAIGGQVTAADASLDGRQLAVLTYDAVHVFEREAPGQNWFTGRQRLLEISAGQCEALCFDRDALLITNEQGQLFRVPLADLQVPGAAPAP
jgi:hypothetical protein